MSRARCLADPPLTFDDLIDLHFLLEADELFLRLLADDPFGTQRR